MKRIILIEPNLIKSFGHVVEFPTALIKGSRSLGIKLILISNENITEEAKNELQDVELYSLIQDTCFADLEDKGKKFYQDLIRINEIIGLTEEDLILCLTSYTNEILGAHQFTSENPSVRINLWMHQLYPPVKVFNDLLINEVRNQYEGKLKEVLESVSMNTNLNIFTTESDNLRSKVESYLKRSVYTLPLPYNEMPINPEKTDHKINLGFLGDGRYEKGGLLALKALNILLEENSHTDLISKFILQIINPRGYDENEFKIFQDLKSNLSSYDNVEFISEGLSSEDFYRTLNSIDLLILPYHPKSYDERVSGIMMQAMLQGIPVIATEETWLGETLRKYRIENTFKYSYNLEADAESLYKILLDTLDNYDLIAKRSKAIQQEVKSENNSINFLDTLIKLYEEEPIKSYNSYSNIQSGSVY